MRITSIRLRNLRRHSVLALDLAPGLTVVRGPNEAGKSTLQRAIELALTRKVTSSGIEMDSWVRWDAAAGERPEIDMAFTWQDDDGVAHEGWLEKRFLGAKGTVRLDLGEGVITDPARADEELAALSGIPTEKFFGATASVRHHELDGLDASETMLRDRLQTSISGADEGSGKAKTKLADALRKLRQAGPKNHGRLKMAEDALKGAELTVRNGEAALARLETDRDALGVAREQRAAAEAALAEESALLERAGQAERLTAERERARVTFERYEAAAGAAADLAARRAEPGLVASAAQVRVRLDALAEADTKVATLIRLAEAAPGASGAVDLDAVSTGGAGRLLLAVLLLVGGIAAAGAGGAALAGMLGAAMTAAGPGALAAGALLVVIALAMLVRRLRIAELNRQIARALAERAQRARRERERFDAELTQARMERDERLAVLGYASGPAARMALDADANRADAIAGLVARLGGLLAGEPSDELVARRNAAALDMAQKDAALESLGPIARDARARERHEAAAGEARRALEVARDAEANARARVDQNKVDAEEVAAQAERLAMWRMDLAALHRRERVYALALDAITRAETATMARASVFLQAQMAADIDAVTASRYKRVRVDDTNLGIEVFAPERGGWVKAQQLSQGTVDVVYLAARLGLVRLVTGNGRPPLILDDPFVTLDDTRGPRALELLRRISADFQVIYLTTSDRYDAIADKVIEMAGPTAVDTGSVSA